MQFFGFLLIGIVVAIVFFISSKTLSMQMRAAVMGGVTLIGAGIYMGFGAPDYGSKKLAVTQNEGANENPQRMDQRMDQGIDNIALDKVILDREKGLGQGGISFQDMSPETLISRGTFDRLVADDSQDSEKWVSVAVALRLQKDFQRAAQAFGAAAQSADDVSVQASYYGAAGEAMVEGAQGSVNDDAMGFFEKALMADPTSVGAHYYLGVGSEVRGDKLAASRYYRQFMIHAPNEHPLRREVANKLRTLPAANGPSVLGAAIAPELDQNAIDKVAALSPEDQQAFIQTMVARLQSRLDENGGDFESWRRLARAHARLGNIEAAKKAYNEAIAVSPNPDVLILERDALK